ncbi:phage baseplate protein [Micromonospora zhanjiangensis]
MQDRQGMSRRRLIRTAGLGGAIGLGAIWAGGAALAASTAPAPARPSGGIDPATRFDLAAPGTALFEGRPLHDATVIQSLAFDNVNKHVYTVQLMAGGRQLPGESAPVSGATRGYRGDLCLTRLDLAGNELGHMYLTGFGHGVQIGAEPVGSSAFLWTEVDAVADDGTNGWGTQLARFRFVDGAVRTPDSPRCVGSVRSPARTVRRAASTRPPVGW